MIPTQIWNPNEAVYFGGSSIAHEGVQLLNRAVTGEKVTGDSWVFVGPPFRRDTGPFSRMPTWRFRRFNIVQLFVFKWFDYYLVGGLEHVLSIHSE